MSQNKFSIEALKEIFNSAFENGYKFLTMNEYLKRNGPVERCFITRLDLDFKPASLKPFVALSLEMSIPFTLFVRVAGPYNVFWYPHFQAIESAAEAGFEIGLHTSPVEWAAFMKRDVEEVFAAELSALRFKFPVVGVAPHRDINYAYNSLPWLDENWALIGTKYKLNYHAYEQKFFQDFIYVNEGLSPHLGWRDLTPMDAIKTGKNIYMLLHPHWWFVQHPFEVD